MKLSHVKQHFETHLYEQKLRVAVPISRGTPYRDLKWDKMFIVSERVNMEHGINSANIRVETGIYLIKKYHLGTPIQCSLP